MHTLTGVFTLHGCLDTLSISKKLNKHLTQMVKRWYFISALGADGFRLKGGWDKPDESVNSWLAGRGELVSPSILPPSVALLASSSFCLYPAQWQSNADYHNVTSLIIHTMSHPLHHPLPKPFSLISQKRVKNYFDYQNSCHPQEITLSLEYKKKLVIKWTLRIFKAMV